MYYERKIKYLDYYERGERIRGGGHVKLEVRDGRLRMELAVAGMHATDSFSRDINLCTEKREFTVGTIDISEGRGSYRQQWNRLENIGGSGISYEELSGIRIPLGAGREISCHWQVQNRDGRIKQYPGNGEIRAAESNGDGKSAVFDRGAGGMSGTADKEKKDIVGRDGGGRLESRRGEERGDIEREAWGVPGSESRNRESDMVNSERNMTENRSIDEGNGLERGERDIPESGNREERGGREREVWGAPGSNSRNRESSIMSSKDSMAEHRSRNVRNNLERGESDIAGNPGRNVRSSLERGESDIAESRSRSGEKSVQRETGSMWEIQKEETRKRKPVKLLENKWVQLWAIYPHIKPFNDEREYISIGPSDFVLFPEASYKMVNNSFLLHGFYNYNHLLLARVEKRGEAMYYIGVPGNFYEKEKQVAIMFGFESFECAEEPAQAGDFGYYMMRTGL